MSVNCLVFSGDLLTVLLLKMEGRLHLFQCSGILMGRFFFSVLLASGFPSLKSMMCKFGDIKGVLTVLNISIFYLFSERVYVGSTAIVMVFSADPERGLSSRVILQKSWKVFCC